VATDAVGNSFSAFARLWKAALPVDDHDVHYVQTACTALRLTKDESLRAAFQSLANAEKATGSRKKIIPAVLKLLRRLVACDSSMPWSLRAIMRSPTDLGPPTTAPCALNAI
jgi:hypothetical protein